MNRPRLLIACVGNIFLGEDAFGVEVARASLTEISRGVRVVDFGIRGLDLAYALLDGHEVVILVDATPCGPPGTLHLVEPNVLELAKGSARVEGRGMDPVKVLPLAS